MESNTQYKLKEYWDERFKTEKSFEWLKGLESFSHIVTPLISMDARIAHIGCGSSQVSMQLYDLGYHQITNIDYSKTLIEQGKNDFPEMEWIEDDIRTLNNCCDNSFDVVFEKATIEALLVTEKSPWDPSDEALCNLDDIFHSIGRVLKEDGLFISVSFTQPHFRIPALMRYSNWSIEYFEFGDSFHYYVYVCRLGKKMDEEFRKKYSSIASSWMRKI